MFKWFKRKGKFSRQLHPEDKILTNILSEVLKCNDVSVEAGDEYRMIIHAGDIKVKFWNRNYPRSWMNEGKIMHGNKLIYTWDSMSPSEKVLMKFDELVHRSLVNQVKEIIGGK
jgi:hypothetical protein